MFPLVLTLSFLFQITFGQVAQLANLTVNCDENGIQVHVNFDSLFNGIIYSKGYYKNNKCRYVQEGSNQTDFEFTIDSNSCGTEKVFTDKKSQTMENILIIQNDPIFQEQADLARLIACRHSSAKVPDLMHRRVIFKPYMVDNLEVISIPMQDDEGNNRKVDLWMDITLGVFPDTENLEGPVKVGDNLTLSIYVKDTANDTDIRIKDCYAYDNMKSAKNNQKPAQLQLSEENGCPLREQLLSVWSRTYNTMDTGASIIAFNNLKAFKFPERDSVFLACNIDLCKGNCTERCELEGTNPNEEPQQNLEENDDANQDYNQSNIGNDYDDPNTIDSSSLGDRRSIGIKKIQTQKLNSQKKVMTNERNSQPNHKNLQLNRRNQQQNLRNAQFNSKNLQPNHEIPKSNLKNQRSQINKNYKLNSQPLNLKNNLKYFPQNEEQYLFQGTIQSQNEPQLDNLQQKNVNDDTQKLTGKSFNNNLFQKSSMSENSIAKKNNIRKSSKKFATANKQFGPAKKFDSQINFNQQSQKLLKVVSRQSQQQLLQHQFQQQAPQHQLQQQILQQHIPQQQSPQQQQQFLEQHIPQQQASQQQQQFPQQQAPQHQLQQQILQQHIPQQQQQFPQQQVSQHQPQQQILQQQAPQHQLQQQFPQQLPQQQIPQALKKNQFKSENNQIKKKVIRKKINQAVTTQNQPQLELSNLNIDIKSQKSLSYLDTNNFPLESPKQIKPLVTINNPDLLVKEKELIILDAISSAKIAATLVASQPKLSQPVLNSVKFINNSSQGFGARQFKKA